VHASTGTTHCPVPPVTDDEQFSPSAHFVNRSQVAPTLDGTAHWPEFRV